MRHISGEGLHDKDMAVDSDSGDVGDHQDESDVAGKSIDEGDQHALHEHLNSERSDKSDITGYHDEPPEHLQSHSRTSSYSKAPTSSKALSTCSKTTKVSSTSSKRTRVDAFREENETREKNMVLLASKKLDYKAAELVVKKQKLDLNNHREMEKERLVAEERILQQKERMQEKDHLRQKQAEEHQERILRLQIQLAQTQNTSSTNGPSNFSNQLPNFSNQLPSFSNQLPTQHLNFEHFTDHTSYDSAGRM